MVTHEADECCVVTYEADECRVVTHEADECRVVTHEADECCVVTYLNVTLWKETLLSILQLPLPPAITNIL